MYDRNYCCHEHWSRGISIYITDGTCVVLVVMAVVANAIIEFEWTLTWKQVSKPSMNIATGRLRFFWTQSFLSVRLSIPIVVTEKAESEDISAFHGRYS